jgi:hypothetical protein
MSPNGPNVLIEFVGMMMPTLVVAEDDAAVRLSNEHAIATAPVEIIAIFTNPAGTT